MSRSRIPGDLGPGLALAAFLVGLEGIRALHKLSHGRRRLATEVEAERQRAGAAAERIRCVGSALGAAPSPGRSRSADRFVINLAQEVVP